MGYVGNQSTNAYSSLPAKQDLTGATGTSLTLSQAVSGPESIDLFINNVRQEPTTAYSVSDTTVTLTGSVVATDDIYVVYNGLALQTIVPPDGSVTLAKAADSLYRAGTWTPTIKDDSDNPASFTTTLNQYVRIGNVVHLFLSLNNIDTTGLTSGDNINLGGLPFNHIAGNSFSTLVHTQSITLDNITGFTVRFLDASNRARFEELRTGQNDITMKVSDLTSGSADIGFNAFYLTDDA